LRLLLEQISGARTASFLAVLKTLGGRGHGYLSFPLRGYTLALDFPRRAGIEDLLARLERITHDHGGRIYLAKDAVLSAPGFARMYPDIGRLQEVLARVDPHRRFCSDMARRLGLRP
ncbi:MAG: D-arabinono-1,4-lactone oxidase, partial [Pseudomonadota bacterium]